MQKTLFNRHWTVRTGAQGPFEALFGGTVQGKPVTLPHDAMIEETRDPNCPSGGQNGFYPTKSYTYIKTFSAPEDWQGQKILIRFEGVMQKAMVYLNGEFLGGHSYGYTGFTVDLTSALRYGKKNDLKVLAIGQELWTRWYSGMGIYRDVYLLQGGPVCFTPDGLKITTESVEDGYAVLRVDGAVENRSDRACTPELRLTVGSGGTATKLSAVLSTEPGGTISFSQRITVDDPALWSPDSPNLYTCTAELLDGDTTLDSTEARFGIRTLRLDARQGLRINGETVKLRGACIHHDNGIIGCTNLYQAERFRMEQLKAAGFNAIRSAHHPAGDSLLRACDEVGILVMDELSDMWNEPKNPNDFSLDFDRDWQDAAAAMVEKDYNHPSVVLYSTGNEIPEIGRAQGTVLHRRITEALKALDPTRYTTCGINGFLAVSDCMGDMIEEQKREAITASTAGAGSEGLNTIMGATDWSNTDKFSVSPLLTQRLEPAISSVDVAGYNYLTARHVLEHENHPDRVVVGSETFPPEIGRLWKIVEENPHVIGDFTWTGYDYLGEAGIGIPHYTQMKSLGGYPDRLAYCGDINLNADRRPVSFLREIAFGLRSEPFIAVHRPEVFGKTYDHNNWKYFDSIDSWTFPGYEEKPTRVYVLANCDEVELFLNGGSLGRKQVGELLPLTAVYDLAYRPGELKAVGYNAGTACGECVLTTAEKPVAMRVSASDTEIEAGGQGVAFLTVDMVDSQGRRSRFEKKTVSVKVEGAGTLLGFGSANPSCEGSYQDCTWDTFDGRIMAAIRGGEEPGDCKVTFSAEGCADVTVSLTVVKAR